jgi:hypothetical protein
LLLISSIEIALSNRLLVGILLVSILRKPVAAVTLLVDLLIVLILPWFILVRVIHICMGASVVAHNARFLTYVAEVVGQVTRVSMTLGIASLGTVFLGQ